MNGISENPPANIIFDIHLTVTGKAWDVPGFTHNQIKGSTKSSTQSLSLSFPIPHSHLVLICWLHFQEGFSHIMTEMALEKDIDWYCFHPWTSYAGQTQILDPLTQSMEFFFFPLRNKGGTLKQHWHGQVCALGRRSLAEDQGLGGSEGDWSWGNWLTALGIILGRNEEMLSEGNGSGNKGWGGQERKWWRKTVSVGGFLAVLGKKHLCLLNSTHVLGPVQQGN